MSKNTIVAIYARYSTDMQSTASCKDQVRQVREGLTKLGIDHSNALVLTDEAMSGMKSDRPNFQRLLAMIERHEVSILAVDEQSRLTRGFDATKIIQNLKYCGGRFISVSENVDSNNESWKMLAGFKQITNNVTIDEIAWRVRRGQKGRIEDNLSAGDYPFGYEAYYKDPQAALRFVKGPKPEKGIRIKDAEATIVREIFERFVSGQSITAIARELTSRCILRGNRVSDTRWSHQQVRRLLANSKFVGEWIWGKTRSIHDGGGNKRQAETPKGEWVVVQRPYLRIIDASTWEAAQAKLRSIHDRYGKKEGQRKRGPAVHHSVDYPTGLLDGILRCQCGARMHKRSKHRIGETEQPKYFVCPTEHKDRSACKMASHVPADKAEQAVVETILRMFTSHLDWQGFVLEEMKARILANSSVASSTVAGLQQSKKETQRKLDNLVAAIIDGSLTGMSVKGRLAELESELELIDSALGKQNQVLAKPLELPDDKWIAKRFHELSTLMTADPRKAAILIRKLIPCITANHVIAPGKRRGYTQIRFSVNRNAAIQAVIDDPLMETITNLEVPSESGHDSAPSMLDEFIFDLGSPTQYDAMAPKIAAMRAAGATWKSIQTETGIDIGNLYNVWARYITAMNGEKPAKSKGASIFTENSIAGPSARSALD